MSNKIDNYFREKLTGFEQSPPDSAWDQIVTKLRNRKKKKAVMIFFRIAAGMAILISTGIGVYLLNRSEDQNKHEILSRNNNTPAIGNESNQTAGDNQSDNLKQSQKGGQNEATTTIALSKPDKHTDVDSNLSDPSITASSQVTENVEQSVGESETFETVLNPIDNITTAAVTPVSDSIMELRIPDLATGSVMTSEEETEILLAQDNNEGNDEKRDRRWTVGSEIAPLYSYRSINTHNYNYDVSSLNSSENGILAYAGGIRVALNTGKRLSVQSGLYYSRYGLEINQVQAVASTSTNADNYNFIAASNSTGNIEGIINERYQSEAKGFYYYQDDFRNGITNSSVKPLVQGDAENIQLKQYFDYFELPLILKYKIIDRKLDFSLSGGLITNFLVGNAVDMITDGESKRVAETSDINITNYLGSVGMGFEMPVSANFSFTLEPRFRYHINPIDPSDISVHPYSFGFFAGINYKF